MGVPTTIYLTHSTLSKVHHDLSYSTRFMALVTGTGYDSAFVTYNLLDPLDPFNSLIRQRWSKPFARVGHGLWNCPRTNNINDECEFEYGLQIRHTNTPSTKDVCVCKNGLRIKDQARLERWLCEAISYMSWGLLSWCFHIGHGLRSCPRIITELVILHGDRYICGAQKHHNS